MFTGRVRDGHAERKRPSDHPSNGYRTQPGTAQPTAAGAVRGLGKMRDSASLCSFSTLKFT